MKEFKDKLNRKLEELIDKSFNESLKGYPFACARNGAYQEVKMIIDQLSEEYKDKAMSNADKIRSMTNKEMSTDLIPLIMEVCEDGVPCDELFLEWLQSEAE